MRGHTGRTCLGEHELLVPVSVTAASKMQVFYLSYEYRYHSHYIHKRTGGTSARYMYHCAQSTERQHAPSKTSGSGKQRDKIQMDTFKCHGWLHITLSELDDLAYIKIDHKDHHVPYVPIDVPEDIKELISKNLKWIPTQVCIYIH
jgi:hypothetical protein